MPATRILFLTSGDRVPSTRFRVLPFVPHYRADGLRCSVASSFPQKYDYFPWIGFRPSQLLKRLVRRWHWFCARLHRFDIVFIEREIFNDDTTWMEERFRKIARHVVLDVDDAIFLQNPTKLERLIHLSDLVITGNPQIDAWVRQYSEKTLIVPTGVELAQFPLKEALAPDQTPIIGWIGTTGNLAYLEVVAPALRRLAETHEFELRLIVPEFRMPQKIDLRGVTVKHEVWNGPREVDQLRQMDIGLMPLFPDREWDKYKCPTKLIQYMAVGIPGVASPIGFTGDVITHGKDGFLATTTEDWVESLQRLIEDHDLRRRVGAAGRETVAASYCVEANWKKQADAFRRLVAR